MIRPSRYVVWYESPALVEAYKRRHPDDPDLSDASPSDTWRGREFEDLADAWQFADTEGHGEVVERINVHEDPEAPGMWDWDEKPAGREAPQAAKKKAAPRRCSKCGAFLWHDAYYDKWKCRRCN